ncbi:hypothetical protein AMTRI_Chr06g174610 [Amborella trichopoda]
MILVYKLKKIELEMPFVSIVMVAKNSDGTTYLLCHIKVCCSHPHQEDLQQSLVRDLETFKFDQEISRKALAKMIITHGYPFCMVEHPAFREFVKNLQPKFNNMVGRTTIKNDCMAIYQEGKK